MKKRRREARELAMKVLFQVEVGHWSPEEVLTTTAEAVPVPAEEWAYVREVVEGVERERPELDRIIAERAVDWKLERIANVDRSILRLALYEILHRPDIPPSVSVNEAVELAKKYSTEDSGKFVNGILGSYLRSEGAAKPTADADRVEETVAPQIAVL
jgi:transcription antitermination protein NusB